jgi:hypothetical protein
LIAQQLGADSAHRARGFPRLLQLARILLML